MFDPSVDCIHYQLAPENITYEEYQDWERRKIKQHQPAANKHSGGNGRIPAIFVDNQPIEPQGNETYEDAADRLGLLQKFVNLFRG